MQKLLDDSKSLAALFHDAKLIQIWNGLSMAAFDQYIADSVLIPRSIKCKFFLTLNQV